MYRLACPGLLLAATAAAQWTALDYEPTVREVVLDTDFTRIVPRNAPPFDVTGGVFMFRNVRISQGSRCGPRARDR